MNGSRRDYPAVGYVRIKPATVGRTDVVRVDSDTAERQDGAIARTPKERGGRAPVKRRLLSDAI